MGDDEVLNCMNDPRANAQVKPGYYHNPGPDRSRFYNHPDVPGAGAKKRHGVHGKAKIPIVMGEFKRGTLRSGGSGAHVTNRRQAVAIAMEESGMSKKKRSK
jgi:hypothetical protein